MRYLLDTNVCIGWLRAHRVVSERLRAVGFATCAISEVTLAELYFGIANSPAQYQVEQEAVLAAFLRSLLVLPICGCSREKKPVCDRSAGGWRILIYSSVLRPSVMS